MCVIALNDMVFIEMLNVLIYMCILLLLTFQYRLLSSSRKRYITAVEKY